MSTTFQKIDACLATLGSDAFAPVYADFVATLGVDQIMAFSLEGDRARCLLSRHFSNAALAGKLAAAYLDGWFLRDPLLPALRAAEKGCVQLRRLDEISSEMEEDYQPGLFIQIGWGRLRAPESAVKSSCYTTIRQQLRTHAWVKRYGRSRPDSTAPFQSRPGLSA